MHDISKTGVKSIITHVDVVHQNDGSNIHGRIADGKHWRIHWETLTVLLRHRYNLISIVVGWHFLDIMNVIRNGIADCGWNSDWLILFLIVVIQHYNGAERLKDNLHWIQNNMGPWEIE